MEQESVYFGKNGIIKSVFHKNKGPININEVDIKEIVLSHKNQIVKIHLNTLLDPDIKVMILPSPLCVKLPQMNTYAKYFDKNNKHINLLVNDKELLKKIFRNME